VGKDDDTRQNVARSTNWKTLQPWQAEKNRIEVYTRIYSLSIPALTSVTFMLWNWVLPYFEALSLALQCAAGGSGRHTEIRYRMWPYVWISCKLRRVSGEEILTRSVTLRCCSNSVLANWRMSFRAPSSGMFAVLRTISRHRASARCRCMNYITEQSFDTNGRISQGDLHDRVQQGSFLAFAAWKLAWTLL
jgi:hypothetical protein